MAMWKESLKIGVDVIDSQHKELCNHIDALFNACNSGKGRDEIFKTLEFLEDYTIKHFSNEERLQLSSSYPKYKEHKKLHEYFKKQIADLKNDIAKNGATVASVSKTNYFLMNWLLNHIQRVDKELANYIK